MELLLKMLALNLATAACCVSSTVAVHREYELPVGKYVPEEACKRPECMYQAPEACMGNGHVSYKIVPQRIDAATKDTFERICSVLRKTRGCNHWLGWRDDECPEIIFILRTEDGYTSLSCSVDTCTKCCMSTFLGEIADATGRELKFTTVYELIYYTEELGKNELGIQLEQCACRNFRTVFCINNHHVSKK